MLLKNKALSPVICMMLVVALMLPVMPRAKAYDLLPSENLVNFIKYYEGYRQYAYSDSGGYSIGYGSNCNPSDYPNGISEAEAEALLRRHLQSWVDKVNSFASKNGISFSQNQFDALCTMCYNLGGAWLDTDCRITRYLKGQETYTEQDLISAFAAYCHVGTTVLDGLLQRRMDEACVFLYGDYFHSVYKNWKWAIINTNGGAVNPDATIFCFKSGQIYGNLPTPTMNGLVFKGWQTASGKYVTNNDVVNQNLYLYAAYGTDKSNFSDVKASDWFYEHVICLTGSGVISGKSDGTFGPKDAIDLGSVMCLLLKTVGYPEQPSPNGIWSQGYVDFARGKGFLDGIDDLNPKRKITRDEIAHIVCNMFRFTPSGETPYSDTDSVYATALYEAGLMEGSVSGDTRIFMPEATFTRAAMAVVIYKIALIW